MVTKVEPTGLGGSLNVTFLCNGCQLRAVNFNGSALVEGSRRTVVGLALAVAFFNHWAWLCKIFTSLEAVPRD